MECYESGASLISNLPSIATILKKVYCIIVTYNGMRWIKKCLESLRGNSYPLHVIVVDNGSTDATKAFVADNYPWVSLIDAVRNLGFGQANNLGVKNAILEGADYIFLLNQDAIVEPTTISQLVNRMMIDKKLGIISPIHFNGDGSALDNNFFSYLLQSDTRNFISRVIFQCNVNDTLIPTKFVNAAAWLISRECILKTGGFDPIFFHYGEDRNYCQRVLFQGLTIAIDTKARIYHDRGDRKPPVTSIRSTIKEDWIHILSTVCDIGYPKVFWFLSKRLGRHFSFAVTNLAFLRLSEVRYHSGMCKAIITGFPGIIRSRRKYFMADSVPYLD